MSRHPKPHGTVRLTERAVRAIRRNRRGWPRWRQALVYRVHLRTIDAVHDFKTWRWVR